MWYFVKILTGLLRESLILISIVGYHTCGTKGGTRQVIERAPFLSGDGHRQWLTQGYYFWTDSEYFAHRWGKQGYKNRYAIVRCHIEIEDHLVLDLVGSVLDQLYFSEQVRDRRKALLSAGVKDEDITVNGILSLLRAINSEDEFPYIAVKAQDIRENATLPNENKFPYRKGKPEYMPAITRQQLCLFEQGYDCIVEKQTIYPNTLETKLDV